VKEFVKPEPILRSKLFPPRITSDFIRREGLYEKMKRCADVPLTLVSEPAGYGKSSLISDWLFSHQYKFAWISLDEEDTNFIRFIKYLIFAIQKNVGNFGKTVMDCSILPSLFQPHY